MSGTVFQIDNNGLWIDIGAKSSAFCPVGEISLNGDAKVSTSLLRATAEPLRVWPDYSMRVAAGLAFLFSHNRTPRRAYDFPALHSTRVALYSCGHGGATTLAPHCVLGPFIASAVEKRCARLHTFIFDPHLSNAYSARPVATGV